MKFWPVVVLMAVGAVAVLVFSQQKPQAKARITLESDPFPMVIGPTTLRVSVRDSQGAPINATVQASGEMMHEGMLPLNIESIRPTGDATLINVTWPMAGEWALNFSAQLPNNGGTIDERFDVYVYSTQVTLNSNLVTFHSASQNRELITDPAHEFGIIIPQGTKMLMMEGQAPDVIPTEIFLSVRGQNTLIIQNNDVVDHFVGPYMVRAGEMLRQTFATPAVYEGKCSINLRAKVRIVVDA